MLATGRPYTLQRLSQLQLFLAIEDFSTHFLIHEQEQSKTVKQYDILKNRAYLESEKDSDSLILTDLELIYFNFYSMSDSSRNVGSHRKATTRKFHELRAERMAKNANPLALVATAQTLQDPYYQTSKPHKSYAPTSKASLPTRSHATTRYKEARRVPSRHDAIELMNKSWERAQLQFTVSAHLKAEFPNAVPACSRH
ncbi:hypothetical protein Tco_1554889 [Tanacetum coccineum]